MQQRPSRTAPKRKLNETSCQSIPLMKKIKPEHKSSNDLFNWKDVGENERLSMPQDSHRLITSAWNNTKEIKAAHFYVDSHTNQRAEFPKNKNCILVVHATADRNSKPPFQPKTDYISLVVEAIGFYPGDAVIAITAGDRVDKQIIPFSGKATFSYRALPDFVHVDSTFDEFEIACAWRPKVQKHKQKQNQKQSDNPANPLQHACM